MLRTRFVLISIFFGIAGGPLSQAAIIGPYGTDANTLHLYHLEEAAVNLADSGSGTAFPITSLGSAGVAATQLNVTSYPNANGNPNFGKSFKSVTTTETGLFLFPPVNGAGDNVSLTNFQGVSGSFTYDMILRADFNPVAVANTTNYVLASGDNENTGGGGRTFQWSLDKTAGNWTTGLISLGNPTVEQLTSSTISIVQGHWYHAAMTYSGTENTPDNLTFYWTDMGTDAAPNDSAVLAALVSSHMMIADFPSTNSSDFAFGTEARASTATQQYPGLIDEIRVSNVARGASEFIFVPEPASLYLVLIGIAGLGRRGQRQPASE